MEIDIAPVTLANIEFYISVGIQSYKEHYLHLWKNQDPSPFINAHLSKESVVQGLNDSKQLFYLIKADGSNAGILNLTLDSDKEACIPKKNLLLNKIYLLNTYSGNGIGSKTLGFVHSLAKKHQKEIIWLYAMKKGKPLNFYKKHNYAIVKEAFIALPHVLDEEKEMWLMQREP
ncbi:GNAT family N-acetyltransferase [uncultured Croceitalea sp.]|uniref:GNAT family N-acetyltransferase n=1 Tax=uncultured Croceitalea sp. TaxID=1798908 RepID=UPI0033063A66